MISERLLDIRNEKEITQKEIAKILEVSRGHYSMWESGKEIIPLKKINLLCNRFNMSMDYVIGLTKNNIANGKHKLDSKEIGKNIKLFRNNINLTQKDLATFLDTSQSTISAYEKGTTTLLTAFAYKICKKYNVSLDFLCGRKKENIID